MSILSKKPSVATLPKSREKQFFFIIKNNWLTIFYVSFLYCVSLFPLCFFGGLNYIHYTNLLKSGSSSSELFSTLVYSALILLPCFLFLSLGSAGAYGYFGETLKTNDAGLKIFFRSIKKNALPFLLLYFAEALLFFLLVFNYAFYLYVPFNSPLLKLILLIVSILFAFLFFLAKPYFVIQILFFKTSFIALVRNSFLLPFSRLFHSLTTFLSSSIFYICFFFWPIDYLYILIVLFVIFGGAISLLFSLSFNFSSLEKSLPKEQLGTLYRVGLLNEDQKETE